MAYSHNKNWRLRNPDKRYSGKMRYYRKHRDDPSKKRNSGQKWAINDIYLITAPDRPCDVQLANQLGRSLEAIQVMRAKLKKPI